MQVGRGHVLACDKRGMQHSCCVGFCSTATRHMMGARLEMCKHASAARPQLTHLQLGVHDDMHHIMKTNVLKFQMNASRAPAKVPTTLPSSVAVEVDLQSSLKTQDKLSSHTHTPHGFTILTSPKIFSETVSNESKNNVQTTHTHLLWLHVLNDGLVVFVMCSHPAKPKPAGPSAPEVESKGLEDPWALILVCEQEHL